MPRRVGDTYLWDMVYNITNVTWERESPVWEGQQLSVEYYADASPNDQFELVPRPSTPSDLPNYYYIDVNGSELGPDPGDSIVIGSLNRTHQGATLSSEGSINVRWGRVPDWNETYSIDLSDEVLVNPDMEARTWDLVLTVEAIAPEWERVPWQHLRYRQLIGPTGIQIIELIPYPGDINLDHSTRGFYYVDKDDDQDTIGVGDEIWITGVSTSGSDRTVRFETGSADAFVFKLPERLPYTGGTCQLSEPNITQYTSGGNEYKEVVYTVTSVNATTGDIPLEYVFITAGRGIREESFSFFNGPRHHAISVMMTWGEDVDNDRTISVGDKIYITGLDRVYSEHPVWIERIGMDVASATLPVIG